MARFSRLVFSINMARSKRFWVTRKFWLRLLNVGFSLLKATLTESELIMSNGSHTFYGFHGFSGSPCCIGFLMTTWLASLILGFLFLQAR